MFGEIEKLSRQFAVSQLGLGFEHEDSERVIIYITMSNILKLFYSSKEPLLVIFTFSEETNYNFFVHLDFYFEVSG